MLFDIGWPELLLIGAVALVVIGPKDLPRALRVAGFWVRKARTLSREFQSSIDQMIREAELDEVREELKKAADFNIESEIKKTIDPTGELAESIKPPEVPDYFAEAEGPALAETQTMPALAAPVETALPDPPDAVASTPEPAVLQPPGSPEPSAAGPEPTGSSDAAPAAEPEPPPASPPASPKP